jgi:hypothetical protein
MTDSPRNTDAVDTQDVERTLEAMQFVTPSFAASRARTVVAPAGIARVSRPILLAAALMLVGGGLVFAASRVFPTIMGTPGVGDCEPWECGTDFQVTARITDDPDSVSAYNVVVTDGTGQDRLAEIAQALADRSRTHRVIVWFFSEASGQERHQFPLLPAGDETSIPAPPPLSNTAWRATYDFPASGDDPTTQFGPESAP